MSLNFPKQKTEAEFYKQLEFPVKLDLDTYSLFMSHLPNDVPKIVTAVSSDIKLFQQTS
jgi:hypothetical protein